MSAEGGLGTWPSRGFLSETHSLSMCSDKLCSYVTCPIKYRPCNQPEELCGPCPGCESFLWAVKLTQGLHLKVSSNVIEGATLTMGRLIQETPRDVSPVSSQTPSCPWTLGQGLRPSWQPLHFAFPPDNTAW